MSWDTTFLIIGGTFSLIATGFAVVLWGIGRYHVGRLDDLTKRVNIIGEHYVTRDGLSMTIERIHTETAARMDRFEQKFEDNAKESRSDRHEMRNSIQAVALNVATIAGKSSGVAEIAEAISKAFTKETPK